MSSFNKQVSLLPVESEIRSGVVMKSVATEVSLKSLKSTSDLQTDIKVLTGKTKSPIPQQGYNFTFFY